MDRSPFPGMDPYVEDPAHWKDFHHRFVDDLSDAIADSLPADYVARIEQDVLMLVHDDELDPYTQGFIEIRRLPNQELVTVVEVLSRTNKSGEGRGMYLEKRERLLHQPVSIVEIDLLRSGRRLELAKPLPEGDYYALISRADRRPMCDVFAWTIRDAVPVIPIPLKSGEGQVNVDLRPPLHRTLTRGKYSGLIDYSQPVPPPSVSQEDQQWIAAMVAAQSESNSQ